MKIKIIILFIHSFAIEIIAIILPFCYKFVVVRCRVPDQSDLEKGNNQAQYIDSASNTYNIFIFSILFLFISYLTAFAHLSRGHCI